MLCLQNLRCVLLKALPSEGVSSSTPVVQFVRGIKPRWLPRKSKSKIFYVRKPTPIDPEEAEPLKKMYFYYKTEQRAIRHFLRIQFDEKLKVARAQTAREKDHAAEFLVMEQQVNSWNRQVASVREAAWLEDNAKREAREEKYERRIQSYKEKRLQKAQLRLEKSLEDAKSLVTLDNLDTEIEHLLNQRQDYNFAIDKQGNKLSTNTASPTGVVQLPAAKTAVQR